MRQNRLGEAFRMRMNLDHGMKDETPSNFSVMAVIGLRVCTSSTVCSSRGVETESLLHCKSFQLQD